jgi:hypothetical protein
MTSTRPLWGVHSVDSVDGAHDGPRCSPWTRDEIRQGWNERGLTGEGTDRHTRILYCTVYRSITLALLLLLTEGTYLRTKVEPHY